MYYHSITTVLPGVCWCITPPWFGVLPQYYHSTPPVYVGVLLPVAWCITTILPQYSPVYVGVLLPVVWCITTVLPQYCPGVCCSCFAPRGIDRLEVLPLYSPPRCVLVCYSPVVWCIATLYSPGVCWCISPPCFRVLPQYYHSTSPADVAAVSCITTVLPQYCPGVCCSCFAPRGIDRLEVLPLYSPGVCWCVTPPWFGVLPHYTPPVYVGVFLPRVFVYYRSITTVLPRRMLQLFRVLPQYYHSTAPVYVAAVSRRAVLTVWRYYHCTPPVCVGVLLPRGLVYCQLPHYTPPVYVGVLLPRVFVYYHSITTVLPRRMLQLFRVLPQYYHSTAPVYVAAVSRHAVLTVWRYYHCTPPVCVGVLLPRGLVYCQLPHYTPPVYVGILLPRVFVYYHSITTVLPRRMLQLFRVLPQYYHSTAPVYVAAVSRHAVLTVWRYYHCTPPVCVGVLLPRGLVYCQLPHYTPPVYVGVLLPRVFVYYHSITTVLPRRMLQLFRVLPQYYHSTPPAYVAAVSRRAALIVWRSWRLSAGTTPFHTSSTTPMECRAQSACMKYNRPPGGQSKWLAAEVCFE